MNPRVGGKVPLEVPLVIRSHPLTRRGCLIPGVWRPKFPLKFPLSSCNKGRFCRFWRRQIDGFPQ